MSGQVPSQLVLREVFEGDTLYVEAEGLKVIELGHTDTPHSTTLYVQSIGLVVSGDVVYNNTHPYLAECDDNARTEWLRALDTIEVLSPQSVVVGHGVLDPDSSPQHGDPDGNSWLLQEVSTRLPGRMDHAETAFASVNNFASALRRAAAAPGEHEKRIGQRDENWPDRYAA